MSCGILISNDVEVPISVSDLGYSHMISVTGTANLEGTLHNLCYSAGPSRRGSWTFKSYFGLRWKAMTIVCTYATTWCSKYESSSCISSGEA